VFRDSLPAHVGFDRRQVLSTPAAHGGGALSGKIECIVEDRFVPAATRRWLRPFIPGPSLLVLVGIRVVVLGFGLRLLGCSRY
jgi:hypothetical protein